MTRTLIAIIIATAVVADDAASQTPAMAPFLDLAYCDGWHDAEQQRVGKLAMLRQQLGDGSWIDTIEKIMGGAKCPARKGHTQ